MKRTMRREWLSWIVGYECFLGSTGDRCVVPQYIAAHQHEYDGCTITALAHDGRIMRVRILGKDCDIDGPGTGNMMVRPLRNIGRCDNVNTGLQVRYRVR